MLWIRLTDLVAVSAGSLAMGDCSVSSVGMHDMHAYYGRNMVQVNLLTAISDRNYFLNCVIASLKRWLHLCVWLMCSPFNNRQVHSHGTHQSHTRNIWVHLDMRYAVYTVHKKWELRDSTDEKYCHFRLFLILHSYLPALNFFVNFTKLWFRLALFFLRNMICNK
jgi:hypothetical protein